MNEFWIRLLGPVPRSLIELVRKCAHSSREGNAFDTEKAELVLRVETGPEIAAFVNQVVVMMAASRNESDPIEAHQTRACSDPEIAVRRLHNGSRIS